MRKLLLAAVATLTMATSAFAEIGSLSSDLVFTPLTPCRIVDTRAAGGPIPAGVTRGYKAWGANFTAQGGAPTNCGIPQNTNVAALELNLVVVGTLADGYITAYPFDVVTRPNASTLNYFAGAVLANGATVKVSQASQAFDWNLYTLATTHFVADVTGYYSRPVSAGSLECNVVANETFSVPANFSGFHYTTSICSAGYVAMSAYCWNIDSPNLYLTGSGTNGGAWCGWRNVSGAAINAIQGTNCCRIPGR